MVIASEQQAHEIGHHIGGKYRVFWYEHRKTRLTLFGVDCRLGSITHDPRAAVPAHQ